MARMRLDRFFSSQELLSRKDVKVAVRTGSIQVNGIPAVSAEQQIDPDHDSIGLHGKLIQYKPYLYLMLNKPPGVVSSTDDKRNPTVLDLVPRELYRSGLFPAGRLDKDTVGFVLLTDDGDFAHRILAPRNHISKTYLAKLDAPLDGEGIVRLEQGVTLADGSICQPAKVRVVEEGPEPFAEVILCEGKYHQIKRMFGVLGIGVNWLKRTKMGALELDSDLPEGGCREILHNEVEKILFNSVISCES